MKRIQFDSRHNRRYPVVSSIDLIDDEQREPVDSHDHQATRHALLQKMGQHGTNVQQSMNGRQDGGNRKRTYSQMINVERGTTSQRVIRNRCQSCEEYSVLLDYYRKRVNELEAKVTFMSTLIKTEPEEEDEAISSQDCNPQYSFIPNDESKGPTTVISPVSDGGGRLSRDNEPSLQGDNSKPRESLKMRIHRPQPNHHHKEHIDNNGDLLLDENHNHIVQSSSLLDLAHGSKSSTSGIEVTASGHSYNNQSSHTIKLENSEIDMAHVAEANIPRSGILDIETARKYQMMELVAGTGVYWTASQMISCMENSRDNPCKLLSLMVDIFFTKDDLKKSSAHGQGRYRALDKSIINAILTFIERQYFKLPAAKITQVINNKCAHVRRGPRTGLYTRYKMQRQMRRVAVQREIDISIGEDAHDDITDDDGGRWEIEVAEEFEDHDGGFDDSDVVDDDSIDADEKMEIHSTKEFLRHRASLGKR